MATVKFPSEMPSASNIAGGDKLMISKEANGEAYQATFDQAKEYLNITGIELKPINGGSDSANATVVPAGPAGENRKAEASPGWYNFGSGPVEATSDKRWTAYWNGTSWSLVDMGPLPQQDISGLVPKSEIDTEMGVSSSPRVSLLEGIIGTGVVSFGAASDNPNQTIAFTATKYAVQSIPSTIVGKSNEVKIYHGSAIQGTALTIVQLRLFEDVYTVINSITVPTTVINGLGVYALPNWDIKVGDFFGLVGNVAGLVKYSSDGASSGFFLVDEDGTYNASSSQFADNALSLSYNVVPEISGEETILQSVASLNITQEAQDNSLGYVRRVLGDVPEPGSQIYKIGVDEDLTAKTVMSGTYKYFLNILSYSQTGTVKSIVVKNTDTLVAGTPIRLVQMNFDSEGQIYVLKNSIAVNSGPPDSWNTYNVPNWDHASGDQYGVEVDAVAGVSYYSSAGGTGLIPIYPNLTANMAGFPTGRLSLYANIEVVEDAKTVQERLVDLEAGGSGGGGHFLPRPSNGVVNFQIPINSILPNNSGNTLAAQDSEVLLNDVGILILPTNYDPNGKPVKLLISCHGTGTYYTTSSTSINASSFWNGQGYAILDVNGIPNGIIGNGGTNAQVRHYGSPYALQSYLKAYAWAVENYNIQKEVYVSGISMGGLSSFMLVQSGAIPVVAHAGFCPCIDLYKQAYANPWNGANQRSFIAQLFGFEGTAPTFTATEPPTQPEVDYFLSNYSKVVGYENMLKNVFSEYDLTEFYNDFIPASEAAKYGEMKKHHRVPLKIWHNDDDTTVEQRYSEYYVNMVNNAGGLAYLRKFPSGGHNAWANGATVSGIPTITGGVTSTQASVYECLLWFKRFA